MVEKPRPPASASAARQAIVERAAAVARESEPALRAFRVSLEGLLVGVLGSGPGPFLSASRQRPSNARFEQVQFNSSHFIHERAVRACLPAGTLDQVATALRERGFSLEEVPFINHFDLPVEAQPQPDPDLAQQINDDVRELNDISKDWKNFRP